MNMIASEEISLDRSVPDVRMDECKFWNYPNNLPKVISHQNTITNIPNNLPKVIFLQNLKYLNFFTSKKTSGHLNIRH